MKPAERLYGDLRACLCATKPIRCGCVHCDVCAAMRTIFRNGTVARLRLAFARHYGGRSLRRLFCKGSPRPIPRKRKRPVRTSGPKRELEARRGTGPHTRRGCTVLDLGRCTGTYCFGVAGKLGRGPAFARQKYRYGFSRSCETVLNYLCTQGTCARQDVKDLMGAIKQHLT